MKISEELRVRKIELKYLKAGILELWWDKELEDFKGNEKAKNITQKYLVEIDKNIKEGKGLFYIGSNGVGKTYLLAVILKKCVLRHYSVFFTTLGDLVEMYTEGWHSDFEKRKYQACIKDVDILGIDDIGKEFRGGAGLGEIVFDNLIRYRVQRKKVNIMTSNLQPQELRNIYGESLASLLNEGMRIVKITGYDYRLQQLKREVK